VICRIHYSEILKDKALIEEYAKDCAVDYNPQEEIYRSLDKSGVLYCFGSFSSGELAGFVSIVVSVMPHNGMKMAGVESIFVRPQYRKNGVGLELKRVARDCAKELDCNLIVYLPRIGSEFDLLLSRSKSCTKTHVQYTEWL
jgi:GNAT superfamily N-acetyltransferase